MTGVLIKGRNFNIDMHRGRRPHEHWSDADTAEDLPEARRQA